MTPLQVLVAARARISDPAKWGKGVRGTMAGYRSVDTCCAAEAIGDARESDTSLEVALSFLRQAIVGERNDSLSIVRWNDAPERTHADVLAAFDRAIEAAS